MMMRRAVNNMYVGEGLLRFIFGWLCSDNVVAGPSLSNSANGAASMFWLCLGVVCSLSMKRTGVRPSRSRMFELAYTSKDGSYSDVSTQRKAEEIQNLIVQREEGLNSLDDDHIFTQVFGQDRPGRVRCRGHGITPTSENGTSSRFGSQAIEEARREIEIARKEVAEAKQELADYKIVAKQELADYKKVASDEMNKMKEDMAMMMQALRRLTNQNNGGSGGSEAH